MSSKVLIVDDNLNNLRLLKEILEDENYDVYTESDSRKAMEAAHNIEPHIILLDIMMPEIDGFEVCRLLKEDYYTKDIPVIMVTAKVEGADIKRAMEIGAIDYVKKPIDDMEVVARVKSALKYHEKQCVLEQLAMKDSLTGIYNHALLIDMLTKEISRAERNKSNIAFVMLDIDFFKKVNDTYGHISGDIVLKDLVKLLSICIRENDIIGRYGGEEFGLIVPNISYEDTLHLCERLRKAVEEYVFDIGTQNINITISIGVCFKEPHNPIKTMEIVRRADEALYEAKRSGRNKVVIVK